MKIAILNDIPTRQEQKETFGSKQIKKDTNVIEYD